jgi:hypothetical protein
MFGRNPGNTAGVTRFELAEAALVPSLFVAVTAKEREVPFGRPPIVAWT